MPSLTQPSHTALRLGAIHKKPSVPNRMYVEWTRSSSMWAKAIGLGLSTMHGNDHYELICAEPDPVSGGTRLAKYPSLCQPLCDLVLPTLEVLGMRRLCPLAEAPTSVSPQGFVGASDHTSLGSCPHH